MSPSGMAPAVRAAPFSLCAAPANDREHGEDGVEIDALEQRQPRQQ